MGAKLKLRNYGDPNTAKEKRERAEAWLDVKRYPVKESTLNLINKDLIELREQKECWMFQEEWEQFSINRSIEEANNAYEELYNHFIPAKDREFLDNRMIDF